VLGNYRLWKQDVIAAAVKAHQETLPRVTELSCPEMLKLYDKVLGALTGPHTIRLRRAPRLIDALRLQNSQRSFARALHHQVKFAQLSK